MARLPLPEKPAFGPGVRLLLRIFGLVFGVSLLAALASAPALGARAVLLPSAPAPLSVDWLLPFSPSHPVHNGQAAVSWQPPASDAGSPITGYVIRVFPTYNDRVPDPKAYGASISVSSTTLSGTITGLLEDCHQRYAISVAAQNANGTGTPVFSAAFRPSGAISPSINPPYVVILIDGIGESKPGFSMNPYQPTGDGNPSYCPESWNDTTASPPVEAEADFNGAPTGPWEFFNKWNFNATGTDSGDSTPVDYATGTPTHSFMLDAIAAQGAIILPYGYRGVTVTRSNFTLNEYSKCNSSPAGGAPGVNLDFSGLSGPDPCVIDPGHDGDRQTIDADVGALQDEVSQVINAWPKSSTSAAPKIIIVGHSQGGLVAFEWWKLHGSATPNVTNLFALDSPINGVCVIPTVIGCTGGPVTYPDYSKRKDANRDPQDRSTDAQLGNPFRFIGTPGERVVGYGSGNDTLQRQLLVTGDNCGDSNNQISYSDCPAPPDHISGCPIPATIPLPFPLPAYDPGPSWVTGPVNYHFVVKWCPDNVNYFNDTLVLTYRPEIRTLDVATSGACQLSATVTVAGVVVGQTGPSFASSGPNPGPVAVQDLPGPQGDHSLLVAQSEVVNYTVHFAQPVRAISIQASAAGVPPGLVAAVAPPTTYQGPPANVFTGQLTVPFFPGVVAGRIDYQAQVSGDAQCTIGGTVLAPTPNQVKAITAALALGVGALFLLLLLL